MKLKLSFVTLLILFLFSAVSLAQTGKYDVRFVFVEYTLSQTDFCVNGVIQDLEVRAASVGESFHIAEQNYRFSFNRAALSNPRILTELTLSNTGVDPYGNFSAYNPHTLNGSADTVVSYNVELAFGTGYYLETEWVKVGRMEFDVMDPDACYDLIWHTHAPEDFPPTYIGEKFNNQLYEAQQNIYENEEVCIDVPCILTPVDLSYFKGHSDNCAVQLTWATETETNNDYFEVLKSSDGKDYKSLAIIPAGGNTDLPQSYEYMDRSVDAIDNYYILRQVDYDGSFKEFGPRIIKSKCLDPGVENGISELYPNPTNGNIVHLNFYSTQDYDEIQIELKDVFGRTIDQVNVSLTEGVNLLRYDPSKLANGTYFISVEEEGWYAKPMKLIKTE